MHLIKFSCVDGQNFFQLHVFFFKAVIGRLSSAVNFCFVKQSLHLVFEHPVLRFNSLYYFHSILSHLINSQIFLHFPDALHQINASLKNLILEFLEIFLCY